MRGKQLPTLDDLAFEGRNKAYGAFYLRRRYARYLIVSAAFGILFLLVLVGSLWAYYFFEPDQLVEGDPIYMVEYFDLGPIPDNVADELAKAFAKPPPEPETAPVVRDSVPPEKVVKPEEKPEQKQESQEVKTDSAAKPGGSGLGSGVGEDSGLASSVDVYPRYPGGDEARLSYLRRKVRYPETAIKAQVQGVVMVVFVVETDGSLTNIDVVKKIGGGCDEEAIRVTREMPKWDPGKRNGKPVRVMVRMPIVFRIPGK